MDTKEYHRKVWETAKKDTKLYFCSDKWGRIGEAIAGIVSGSIFAMVENKFGGEMMPIWASILVILFGTAVGMVVFYYVVCGKNGLWVVPARVFRNLEIIANKYTWDDVKIDIFEPSPEDNPTIRLHVTNTKPYDIKAQVFIVELTRNWLLEDEEFLPLRLGWTTNSRNPIFGEIQLDKESLNPTFLPIAVSLEDKEVAYLIMESTEKDTNRSSFYRKIDKDADYRIRLQWCGKIDDQKMDDFYTSYCLRFDGKKMNIKPFTNR
jgi:hypothetical protein